MQPSSAPRFLRRFQIPLLAVPLLAIPAQAGVFAHYSFDADYTDSSGNGRDGTLVDVGVPGNSGIVTSAGSFVFGGGSMDFADEADYVSLTSKTFSSGTAYSIAFWAQRDSIANQWNMVIGDRSTYFFIGLQNNGTLRWRGNDASPQRQQDFAAATDTEWHHYAFVAQGTTVSLYGDGAFVSAGTSKLTGFTFDGIGSAYPAANGFDFRGRIDEMWIFDEALTAAKVSALFASNNPDAAPPYAGFVHSYDGDFSDSSGAGNPGTPNGGAAIATDPAVIAVGTGALALDGADGSYLSLPGLGAFASAQPWSAAWWAKRESIGTNHGMVMGSASDTSNFIWLNDSFTGLRFRSSTNATLDFSSPVDSNLHHYALVADGAGNLSCYIDGHFSESLAGDTSFAIDAIGKAYPTTSLHYNFQGTLDEIHVVPSALNATQVKDLYNLGTPPPPVTRLRIVLVGGQSNADGRAAVADLPVSPVNLQAPQADVDLYYKTASAGGLTTLRPGLSGSSQFGPEIVLGRRMADLWAGETGTRVALIKYAAGGTNLATQWKAGGDATTAGDGTEYVKFQTTVNAGLAALAAAHPDAVLDLQGMVWMQGESDADATRAPAYQSNLTNFIADVRATFGADLPFTIARLSSGQTNLAAVYLDQIRAAQDAVAAADPRTGIVSTDAFGLQADNLHFDAAGQQSLGSGFAGETAYYEWMIDTFSAADIDAGLAGPDADRDGDGRTNRAEFLGATDPLSGSSDFQAVFTRTGPATGEISYATSAARVYAVQHYLEAGGKWETIVAATRGTGATVTKPLALPDARGLFRVVSSLP